MILKHVRCSKTLKGQIKKLIIDANNGSGRAAYELAIIYSPFSVLDSSLKREINASEANSDKYANLAVQLLTPLAQKGDADSIAIIEILKG